MNTLASCRSELRLLLAGTGVPVFEFIPERFTPPVLVLEPGSPFMEQGETFCEFDVSFNVIALATSATNEMATEQVDQLICDVLDAVDTWNVVSVDSPSAFEVNSANYLGTRISFISSRELQSD